VRLCDGMIFALAPFALFSFFNHRGHNGTLGVGQGLVVSSPGDPCPNLWDGGDELTVDLFYVDVLYGVYHSVNSICLKAKSLVLNFHQIAA
jgi:hypothetical protein